MPEKADRNRRIWCKPGATPAFEIGPTLRFRQIHEVVENNAMGALVGADDPTFIGEGERNASFPGQPAPDIHHWQS